MSTCNILTSNVDWIILRVNINVLHVDINKLHIHIPVIISCVHIIDVVCKGQTYATIHLNSFSVIYISKFAILFTVAQYIICWSKFYVLSEKNQTKIAFEHANVHNMSCRSTKYVDSRGVALTLKQYWPTDWRTGQ